MDKIKPPYLMCSSVNETRCKIALSIQLENSGLSKNIDKDMYLVALLWLCKYLKVDSLTQLVNIPPQQIQSILHSTGIPVQKIDLCIFLHRLMSDLHACRKSIKLEKVRLECTYCPGSICSLVKKHGYNRYVCPCCGADVGVHKGDNTPLGKTANPEAKKYRQYLHSALDPLWQEQWIRRKAMYKALADLMKIPHHQCHIANVTTKHGFHRMLNAAQMLRQQLVAQETRYG